MTTREPSDLERGSRAVRRWWWVPLLAALLGAGLAVVTSAGNDRVTYQSVVSTELPNVLGYGEIDPQVAPVDVLVEDLLRTGADELGTDLSGVAVAARSSEDKSSVTVRATADEEATARRGAELYARLLADRYESFVSDRTDRVVSALDQAARLVEQSRPAPDTATTLARLEVRRAMLTASDRAGVADPTAPRQISATTGPWAVPLLMALALASLAVGVIALGALSWRRPAHQSGPAAPASRAS